MTIEVDTRVKVTSALEEYRRHFEALGALDVTKENLQLTHDSFLRLGVLQRQHAFHVAGRMFDLMASHVEIMASEARRFAHGTAGSQNALQELQQLRDRHRKAIKQLQACLDTQAAD